MFVFRWKVVVARQFPELLYYTLVIEERVQERIFGYFMDKDNKKYPIDGKVDGHHVEFEIKEEIEPFLWNVSDTPLQSFPIIFAGWIVGSDAFAAVIEDQNVTRSLAHFQRIN
jgi:hypothetical protein